PVTPCLAQNVAVGCGVSAIGPRPPLPACYLSPRSPVRGGKRGVPRHRRHGIIAPRHPRAVSRSVAYVGPCVLLLLLFTQAAGARRRPPRCRGTASAAPPPSAPPRSPSAPPPTPRTSPPAGTPASRRRTSPGPGRTCSARG